MGLPASASLAGGGAEHAPQAQGVERGCFAMEWAEKELVGQVSRELPFPGNPSRPATFQPTTDAVLPGNEAIFPGVTLLWRESWSSVVL